jgi:hypothetical protein
VLGVFSPPTVWTCRVCSSMYVRGVFPPAAVWTFRVSSHQQVYGCLSTTSSLDVQRCMLSTTSSVHCTVYRVCAWFSTTSIKNLQGVSIYAAWTCNVHSFPPSHSLCQCRNAGLSGIRSVRYRNGMKKNADAGTSPLPE